MTILDIETTGVTHGRPEDLASQDQSSAEYSPQTRGILERTGLVAAGDMAIAAGRRIAAIPLVIWDTLNYYAGNVMSANGNLALNPLNPARWAWERRMDIQKRAQAKIDLHDITVETGAIVETVVEQTASRVIEGQLIITLDSSTNPEQLAADIERAFKQGHAIIIDPEIGMDDALKPQIEQARQIILGRVRGALRENLGIETVTLPNGQEIDAVDALFAEVHEADITSAWDAMLLVRANPIARQKEAWWIGRITEPYMREFTGLLRAHVLPFLTEVFTLKQASEGEKIQVVAETLLHMGMPRDDIIRFFQLRRERIQAMQQLRVQEAALSETREYMDEFELTTAESELAHQRAHIQLVTEALLEVTFVATHAIDEITRTSRPARRLAQTVAEILAIDQDDLRDNLLFPLRQGGIRGVYMMRAAGGCLGGIGSFVLGGWQEGWNFITGMPEPFTDPSGFVRHLRGRFWDFVTLVTWNGIMAAGLTMKGSPVRVNGIDFKTAYLVFTAMNAIRMIPEIIPRLQVVGFNIETIQNLNLPGANFINRIAGVLKWLGADWAGILFPTFRFSRNMKIAFTPYNSRMPGVTAMVSQVPMFYFFEDEGIPIGITMAPMDKFWSPAYGINMRWRSQPFRIGITGAKLGVPGSTEYILPLPSLQWLDDWYQKDYPVLQGFRWKDAYSADGTAEHTRSPGVHNAPPYSARLSHAIRELVTFFVPKIQVWQTRDQMQATTPITAGAVQNISVPSDLPHVALDVFSSTFAVHLHLIVHYAIFGYGDESGRVPNIPLLGRILRIFPEMAANQNVQDLHLAFMDTILGRWAADIINGISNTIFGSAGSPADNEFSPGDGIDPDLLPEDPIAEPVITPDAGRELTKIVESYLPVQRDGNLYTHLQTHLVPHGVGDLDTLLDNHLIGPFTGGRNGCELFVDVYDRPYFEAGARITQRINTGEWTYVCP